MVVAEGDMNSQGEMESPLQSDQQHKNHPFSSIGRQSSIYSLTLDEFQHTLCESGKNFGSMNMDKFLSSIWNFEENQAINSNTNEASAEKGIRKQPSLPRQGSLTLPAPLCRKTVDEVWSEIHKAQQGQQHQQSNNGANDNVLNTESTTRQPTFGEMTLEDFLVKAGVVREPCQMPAPASHQKQYGLYLNNNSTMGPSVIGIGGGTGNVVGSYQAVAQGGGAIGEYPPTAVCHGGRVGNGGSGYGAGSRGMGAPVSPISSDGLATSEKSASQLGADMGVLRGRKRIIDGPVEKVVERRQRRMIKNRESAARSRARKQAYTVELEAELNHLREQNAHLKQALADLERRRKQQCFEELSVKVHTKAQKAKEKLRRNRSCPL